MAIDGPRSECIKSDWYDIIYPALSLVTARENPAHGLRRRQWNRGLSSDGTFTFSQITSGIYFNID